MLTVWVFTLTFLLVVSVEAHPGWGLIVDKEGQIYFGDVVSNTIWKLTNRGKLLKLVTDKHSHQLFLDREGNLYGENLRYIPKGDLWEGSLWKISRDEEFTYILPPTTNPPKGIGAAVDQEGNRYAIDRGENGEVVLLKRSPEGLIDTIARTKGDTLTNVIGITWGQDHSLYMVDGVCVRKVTPDGRISTLGGNPLSGIQREGHPRLLGISVNNAQTVYVADYNFHCIRLITPKGEVRTMAKSGVFWSPSGVTVADSSLYVLEHDPESVLGIPGALGIGRYIRVRRISPTGSVTTLASVWGSNTGLFWVAFVCLVGVVVLLRKVIMGRRKKLRIST